jgi:hypothetical protein
VLIPDTMAANLAALRTMFSRIGFSNDAATRLVDAQGLTSMDVIGKMDSKKVQACCYGLKKPGGQIPHPTLADTMIPDPGTRVGIVEETNLELLAFLVRHYIRVSRALQPHEVTLDLVNQIKERVDYEETWTAAPDEKPVLNNQDWYHTMEDIRNYLARTPGTTKIPLAYVVRESIEVLPSAEDPSTNYTSLDAEMIARAPHGTATYSYDNHSVWNILYDLCKQHESWTHIQPRIKTAVGHSTPYSSTT